LLVQVQVVVWLSEGSNIISRERKERCCDVKLWLVQYVEQILDREGGERERELL